MRLRLVLLLAALAGCTFDASVPSGAAVRCSPESPVCPAGHYCQQRLGRCMPLQAEDREPPQLLSSAVSRSWLARGAALSVDLEVSEPLSVLEAQVVQRGKRFPMQTVPADDAAPTARRVEWVESGELSEGPASVLVTLVDRSGNEAVGLAAGTVTFDFTAPAVRDARVVFPRGSDGGAVPVRPDEAVVVRVTFTEPVEGSPALVQRAQSCALPEHAWTLASNRDGLADFTREPQPGAPDCGFELWLSGAVDLAGNAMEPAQVPSGFRTDGTPPRVGPVALFRAEAPDASVPGEVFSRQPGYATVEARFPLGAEAVALSTAFDGLRLEGCTLDSCVPGGDAGLECRCLRPVDPADREGAHVLTVTARDQAGNESVAVAPLRFDFTAPALVPGTARLQLTPRALCPLASVSALGPGGAARLLFSVDEPVAALPWVGVEGLDGGAFAYESGVVTGFSYDFVQGALPEGAHAVRVRVVDAAGNAAVLGLPDGGPGLLVDATPPAAPRVVDAGAVWFERAPWGMGNRGAAFTVHGPGGAAEPGAVVRVLPNTDRRAGNELGAGAAGAAGDFSIALANVDRTSVFVGAVDQACNESAAVEVKDVTWVATLGGKVPGSAFPNPHSYEVWGDFQGEAARPDGVEPDPTPIAAGGGSLLSTSAQCQWQPVEGIAAPSRGYFTMAWDEARKRAVFFGGYESPGGQPRWGDTWLWDGTSWAKATPATTPGPRNGHATAWDPSRQRVVMFGGTQASGRSNDTWEWDGVDWSLRNEPDLEPMPRDSHAMAWDGRSRMVIMFGGMAEGKNGLALAGDTWGWNGKSWQALANTGPSPRYNHAMAWDPVGNRLLLYGGHTAAGAYNPVNNSAELWEWDGARWIQLFPTGGPVGRSAHAMAFDRARGGMVVHGGLAGPGATDEAWVLIGNAWSALPRGPQTYGGDMVFDPVRNALLYFGGLRANGSTSSETWELSLLGSWTQRGGGLRPPGRYGAAVTWDDVRGRLVVFGGQAGAGGILGDTWEFGEGRWQRGITDGGFEPAPRAYATLDSFRPSGTSRLVGGFHGLDAGLDGGVAGRLEAFDWNGSAWQPVSDALPRGGRYGHSSTTDPSDGTIYLFGGSAGGPVFSELLRRRNLDSTWSFISDQGSGPPFARSAAAMTWDAARGQLVLFGGYTGSAVRDDTFTWSGVWTDAVGQGPPRPPARYLSAMAFDPVEDVVVLHSGGDLTSVLNDTWLWDGAQWVQRRQGPLAPPPALGHSMVSAGQLGQVLRFGGRTWGNVDLAELWSWGLDTRGRPAHRVRFELGRAGLAGTEQLLSITASFTAGGTGTVGAAPQPGAVLWAWDESTLAPTVQNAADAASPRQLVWTTSDPARISRLLEGDAQSMTFVVAPAAANSRAVPALLAVDYAEVRVQYRRP